VAVVAKVVPTGVVAVPLAPQIQNPPKKGRGAQNEKAETGKVCSTSSTPKKAKTSVKKRSVAASRDTKIGKKKMCASAAGAKSPSTKNTEEKEGKGSRKTTKAVRSKSDATEKKKKSVPGTKLEMKAVKKTKEFRQRRR
jgi:hypothetical protein